MSKKINSFRNIQGNEKISVHFQFFNQRITLCRLIYYRRSSPKFTWDEIKEFNGKAKCNVKSGDVFNKKEGAQISYERSLNEFLIWRDAELKKIVKGLSVRGRKKVMTFEEEDNDKIATSEREQ